QTPAETVRSTEAEVATQCLSGIRVAEIPCNRQARRPSLREVDARVHAERGRLRCNERRLAREPGQAPAGTERHMEGVHRGDARSEVEPNAGLAAAQATLRAPGRQRDAQGGGEIRRPGARQLLLNSDAQGQVTKPA